MVCCCQKKWKAFFSFENNVEPQRKMTFLCISLAWCIRCILKNRGVNFLLNDWPSLLFVLVLFFVYSFWNFNRVDIKRENTVLNISLPWILCCYVTRTGVEWLHDLYFFCCCFYFGWKDCCNPASAQVFKTCFDRDHLGKKVQKELIYSWSSIASSHFPTKKNIFFFVFWRQ